MKPSSEDRQEVRRRPLGQSPVLFQKWRQLLFLHWKVDPETIQKTLPSGLTVDRFQGSAFLGVVPFFMKDIRPRFCPALPGISNFLEMNVRTYVFDELRQPGVWFYSLDANQRLAVRVAKRFFHLPYFDARMRAICSPEHHQVDFLCHRLGGSESLASRFRYRGGEGIQVPKPDSLEFFLIERYLLFSFNPRTRHLNKGRVFHSPYPLQEAVVEDFSENALRLAGFDPPGRPPDHLLFSRGVDVEVFSVQPLGK